MKTIVFTIFELYTLKGYWLRDNKKHFKKSCLSPEPVKRTVGEMEARDEGPVNIILFPL